MKPHGEFIMRHLHTGVSTLLLHNFQKEEEKSLISRNIEVNLFIFQFWLDRISVFNVENKITNI
jgi:hypothetical protein